MIGAKNLENKTIKAKKKNKKTKERAHFIDITFHQHNIIILTLGSDREPGAERDTWRRFTQLSMLSLEKSKCIYIILEKPNELVGHQYLYTVLGRCSPF